jgi:hypothetical protein
MIGIRVTSLIQEPILRLPRGSLFMAEMRRRSLADQGFGVLKGMDVGNGGDDIV